MNRASTLPCASALLLAIAGQAHAASFYPADALERKHELLAVAAERAVEQQRRVHLPSIPLAGTWSGTGGVTVERSEDWDVDGDGGCYKITVSGISGTQRDKGVQDRIEVRLAAAMDFLSQGTGIAFWIKTEEELSPDLRFGTWFKGQQPDAIVFNDIPVVQRFGDNPHRVYIDWGHAFANSTAVMATPPNEFWTAVSGFDLPLVHKRIPHADGDLEPASGSFYIDGLELVDIYEGTFDSGRFKGQEVNTSDRLVAQGRTQQVARLCAGYGGEAGRAAAVRAMDMMVRLQSWDGSWPEMRTRLQGEFTHGMIVADLAYALRYLREAGHPTLQEQVQMRHFDGTREQIYETMIHRGGMSRAPGPIDQWKDSYCSGSGALTGGCNRPMVYIVSQFLAAQVLSDPARREELLAEYDQNMTVLESVQGKTAGGWPIFGEGNAFKGKGLHFDLGYTMDHVTIMAYASRVTDDPRWGRMMRRFDRVVESMVMSDGYGFEGGFNERGGGKLGGVGHIKWAPDMVYQEAARHGAPYLAQWGFNSSQRLWRDFPQDMWSYLRSASGYGLGAFLTWCDYDLQFHPVPADQSVVFPRQWPIWSAQWIDKSGAVARQALPTIGSNGAVSMPWDWEVGQYPVAIGLPLDCQPVGGTVRIEVLEHSGRVADLPDDAELMITIEGAVEQPQAVGWAFTVPLAERTLVTVTAADVRLRFAATPVEGAATHLSCVLLGRPPE